jgi:hypothetical protein
LPRPRGSCLGARAPVSCGSRTKRRRRPVEDFWIFDNEQVAVELISGHLTITQPREVAMYAQTFARLAEIAVYGTRASELLSALARTM